MLGIDGDKINQATTDLTNLIAKVSQAIDPTEIRGLIVTLNQTAANLKVVSDKLLKIAERFQ